MSGWRCLVHAHTRRSIDCRVPAAALVRRAAALGVQVLAVTDHDTWQGSIDARDAARDAGLPLRVIPATEASTDAGDLIGLFLREETLTRSAPGFCDAVHAQGGLVLLPHPFRGHRLSDELLARVDLIEVFNARVPRAGNDQALALARERGLPRTVGPDAHRLGELPLAWMDFDGPLPADDASLKTALRESPRRMHTASGSIWNEWRSQLVKLGRRPDAGLAWHLARGAVRRLVKPAEYRVG